MNQITLVSKEGTKFTTSILMADLCTLIQNVLQDYQETEEIPLPHVSSALLELILSYANHHNFIYFNFCKKYDLKIIVKYKNLWFIFYVAYKRNII